MDNIVIAYLALAGLITLSCFASALALASSDNPADRDDMKTYLFYGVASIAWLPLLAVALMRDYQTRTAA